MIRAVVLVSLAYVVARALVVLALGDVFVLGEENEKAFVALALRSGVDVPWARLPYHPYEGGGFLASHLKALAIPLIGATPLMHKVLAGAFGVATLAATMVLAGRHAVDDERAPGEARACVGAALVAGLALVLAPESLAKGSLLHLGIHVEALVFIALVLHLGLEAAAVPPDRPVPRGLLVALGLSAGFGSWFSYQVPIAVLAVIVLFSATRWRTTFRPALMLSTVLGLVPWIVLWFEHGSGLFDLHGEEVQAGVAPFLAGLKAAASGGLVAPALAFGFAATVAGIAFELPRGRRMRALLVVGGFVDLWALAAAVTGLAPGADSGGWFPYLRFAPAVWGLLVVMAIAVGPAIEAAGARRAAASGRIARAAAAVVIGVGGVGLARHVQEGDLGALRSNVDTITAARAVEPRAALVKLLPRVVREDEAPDVGERFARAALPFARVVRDAPPGPWQDALATDLVEAAAYCARLAGGRLPDDFVERLRADLPPDVRPQAVLRGFGPVHFERAHAGAGIRANLVPGGLTPLEAEGVGRFGGWFGVLPDAASAEIASVVGAPLAADYLRGLGGRVFRTGVMRPYWGAGSLYRPERVRAEVLRRAADAGASAAERAALAGGFDDACEAFGFGRPVSSGG